MICSRHSIFEGVVLKPDLLKYSIEVGEAIGEGLPVVALESSIITHGMPYPVNVETALAVEACVRNEGCVPATIAVLDGQIRIGLSTEEISWLGRLERRDVVKVSAADLAYTVSKRLVGSTTVAATIVCARLAGIPILATGGIGGVHRDGENSLDVSADIYELARSDIAVVCAGAKSILDIGRTLELLESYGVPVVGYGTKMFPAFYYQDSGFLLKANLNSPREVADFISSKQKLGLEGGVIVACPVPEADAMQKSDVEGYITLALKEARVQKISGKEVTPFLLERICALSNEKSLACNVALIKNNACVAAQIAKNLVSHS